MQCIPRLFLWRGDSWANALYNYSIPFASCFIPLIILLFLMHGDESVSLSYPSALQSHLCKYNHNHNHKDIYKAFTNFST